MRVTKWSAALLCGLALALPVAAQEDADPKEPVPPPSEPKAEVVETAPAKKSIEDPPLHRWGGWTVSVAAWNPSLVGAEEEIATAEQNGIFAPLMMGSDPAVTGTLEVSYHLPRDAGSIVAHYGAMSQEDSLQNLTPAEFNFLETRAYPSLLGVFDDGRADGVSADALRRSREFRLEFQKRAFDSKWARGTWGAGYRELSHGRALGINYYAIAPNLPPLVPPVPGANGDPLALAPRPDLVSQSSNFSGNGLGGSLDVEFPLHPRVSIVSGISIGLIRGRAESAYTSVSSYYFLNGTPEVPLTTDELVEILNYFCEGDPTVCPGPRASDVLQGSTILGLTSSSKTLFAETLDVYVGVEVTAYRGLKVFGTLRDVSYFNVGEYVVPTAGFSNARTSLNAGYEGYTIGLSWRF